MTSTSQLREAIASGTAVGVWDTSFDDWDSGPYLTFSEAKRHTFIPALTEQDDPTKHRASKSLCVRRWLKGGVAGDVVISQ